MASWPVLLHAATGPLDLVQPRPIFYLPFVSARARDHVTTEELLAATRSTRETLYRWVAQKLLPRPRIATDAGGRQFAAWAPDVLERVRFIAASEGKGLTAAEIAVLVEARWPRR